ncbi:MAG TPA: chorismate mutase [Acidimicrobiales bacterium]|nr:chorismate mutase [Acidimicrobiales bacterium]
MAPAVQALRGATTVDDDAEDQITERVQELVGEMMTRNDIAHDDIISIIFTATEDLVAIFPAAAARGVGLGDVPMLCARELSVDGGTPRCLRVLMHVTTERARKNLRHVYLHGAQGLRDDLPG